MAPAKKVSTSKAPKKATARSAPTHPSWTDMIKECITAHPDDARHGVSRPQIKKFAPISCNYLIAETQRYFRFVEEKYKLEIGNAQITQLSRAIAVGAEKNVFSLPKGPSGRVKLAPKAPKVADDAKENKPASKTKTTTTKTAPKPATKPRSKTKTVTTKSATTKASSGRKVPSTKTTPKAAPSTKAVKKQVPATKPPKPAGRSSTTKADSALKKTYAGKKLPADKKVKSSTSRGTAKKAATGAATASKASKSKAASTKKAGTTSRTAKSTRRT
ncbi:hypothetical protein EDB89DRAFT_1953778 [Lactarius sanguifluus]|nr:hypothetical protein EDB89DRAFT_1953778 [Lactarius sanguifluus]